LVQRLKRTIPVNIAVVHAVDIAHLLSNKDPANKKTRQNKRKKHFSDVVGIGSVPPIHSLLANTGNTKRRKTKRE
jgi:hypothetical protein